MTPHNHNEIADYAAQAQEFLAKSRKHLAIGNLHQASEKACAAATQMAKAAALAQGWQSQNPPNFNAILNQARLLTGNEHLRGLRGIANTLHNNYYMRKEHLDPNDIAGEIENIAELLKILHPLTGLPPAK